MNIGDRVKAVRNIKFAKEILHKKGALGVVAKVGPDGNFVHVLFDGAKVLCCVLKHHIVRVF